MKKEPLSRLRTATIQPLQIEELFLLHLRLGDLCTLIWFGIAPQLSVNMLLGTSFKDRFIIRIFLSEIKVVPWNSPEIPILITPKPAYNIRNTQDFLENSWNEVKQTLVTNVDKRITLEPRTQHSVMVTINEH